MGYKNESENIPLKAATSWMVFLGVRLHFSFPLSLEPTSVLYRCAFLGCVGRKIDGDSWLTWWFNCVPGPSSSKGHLLGRPRSDAPCRVILRCVAVFAGGEPAELLTQVLERPSAGQAGGWGHFGGSHFDTHPYGFEFK